MLKFLLIMQLTLTCRRSSRPMSTIKTVPASVSYQSESIITCVIHYDRVGEDADSSGSINRGARISTINHYE